MSVPIGRGSGPTAGSQDRDHDGSAMATQRRVRHDVADAARLAAVSLVLSFAGALALALLTRWVDR